MTLCTLQGVITVKIAKSRIAVELWPDVRSQRRAVHYHFAHERPDARHACMTSCWSKQLHTLVPK